MRSFIGITGHYFAAEWKLQHIMLECNRICGRHTAQNIVIWFDEVISDFHITEQVKHNYCNRQCVKCQKSFHFTSWIRESDVEDSNSDSEDEIADFELTSYSLDSLSFEHHACFAHMLQLVMKDGMKKVGQINNVLKRCSNLVAFVQKSTIATDLLEGENRLQAENATRWNLQVTMIKG